MSVATVGEQRGAVSVVTSGERRGAVSVATLGERRRALSVVMLGERRGAVSVVTLGERRGAVSECGHAGVGVVPPSGYLTSHRPRCLLAACLLAACLRQVKVPPPGSPLTQFAEGVLTADRCAPGGGG